VLRGKEIEILAPAKNRDIGIAAVDCGADALYIAGPSFGAREAAGNSIEDIELLVKYARRYGVKVYMVINTILYDSEIDAAVKQANSAYEIGCDALIIQDFGLIEAGLPPIPLFASTQTDIRTVEQAMALESMGFSRLILARELSLEQISRIGQAVDIEIESFVHGALCVSYSGQCYMSHRITGRSGNRGECSQMCRSEYNLLDSAGKYLIKDRALLSLKDLNLSGYIEDLITAGVSSFKIEGRLKNISYVKNIVRYYRSVVDNCLSAGGDTAENRLAGYRKASFGKIYGGFAPNPDYTYSRGYTTLNITGVRGDWNSGGNTKSIGEKIGVIDRVLNDKSGNTGFTYISEPDITINNGDGLVFISSSGADNRAVSGVGRERATGGVSGERDGVSDGKIFGARASVVERSSGRERVFLNEKAELRKGYEILRNYNHAFEKELESNMPVRYIDVDIQVICGLNGVILRAISEDGREEQISVPGSFDAAKDIEKMKETIAKQLGKSAGIYLFRVESIEGEVIPFLPLSILNGSRRELAARLDATYAVKEIKKIPDIKDFAAERLVAGLRFDYRANIANRFAKEFYDKLSGGKSTWGFEVDQPDEAELMRCKYCIKFELGYCTKNIKKETLLGSSGRDAVCRKKNLPPEPLYLENGKRKFRLGFDCIRCEMIIFG